MRAGRGQRRGRGAGILACAAFAGLLGSCGGEAVAVGADVERPPTPSIDTVRFVDVADEVGLDFRHGAFHWETSRDTNAMMGGGVCWIDADGDGWLDLFLVDTWSDDEWGRWRKEGTFPSTRLYRNEAGRFTDVTDSWGAGLEVRGNGCVAADLDLDGHTDLYVTTQRENVLLWNDGGRRFEMDGDTAGVDTYGWQAGAAVGDVNSDGWPDLFVAGYADLNRPIPGSAKGFPNPFEAEPDLLFLSEGAEDGERPRFTEVAEEAGIETDRVDYGLGASFGDVDDDGDLDLYVANDTHPNRLYVNEPVGDGDLGFRFVDRAEAAGVDDDEAGMGVASGDYDLDGRFDLAVTNMAGQGHVVYAAVDDEQPPAYRLSLDEMGLPDLGQDRTGWGGTWADIDLDTDLDLLLAHGAIPVQDLGADAEQLEAYENRTAQGETGFFVDATSVVGLGESGRHLGRGLAAADYDNDGDMDLALGTIGGDLALLRNTGAGGHWLVVDVRPATPGTVVTTTLDGGTELRRELRAGSSYLSSEDPRAHFGLGANASEVTVEVAWPDGTTVTRTGAEVDRILEIRPD